uniref:Uncharacterized protein n=1 Tax=Syphacia muris TaxID=451379 RepID=A0A0N5AQ90_9BILA
MTATYIHRSDTDFIRNSNVFPYSSLAYSANFVTNFNNNVQLYPKNHKSLSEESNAEVSTISIKSKRNFSINPEEYSTTNGENTQSIVENKKCSQKQRSNSGSNAKRCQHPVLFSSTAYQNFLIREDELCQCRPQHSHQHCCTARTILPNNPPHLNGAFQNNKQTDSALNQINEPNGVWEGILLLTKVFRKLRLPLINSSSSPSGTLLPLRLSSTVVKENATENSIREQVQKTKGRFQKRKDDAIRKVQRYVYFGQGLLIATITLVWLASYLFFMKSPNIPNNNQRRAEDGTKLFQNTIPDTSEKFLANINITVTSKDSNFTRTK